MGRALLLDLEVKFQLQLCPFSSLSLTQLTRKMLVIVTNALTAPGILGRLGALV